MIGFADLHKLPEDDRIRVIGDWVLANRKVALVPTDDEPGKAERYQRKLRERYPWLVIGAIMPGPVDGCVSFRVGPPPASNN